jgi:hypothetical protein
MTAVASRPPRSTTTGHSMITGRQMTAAHGLPNQPDLLAHGDPSSSLAQSVRTLSQLGRATHWMLPWRSGAAGDPASVLVECLEDGWCRESAVAAPAADLGERADLDELFDRGRGAACRHVEFLGQ